MRNLVAIILVLFLLGCSKHSERDEDVPPVSKYPGFKEYFIPQGSNYSRETEYHAFRETDLSFSAIFDSSAIYTTVDPSNQGDINKLYGVSDGNSHHQENSARFGWNWTGNELQVHAYCYAGGVRENKLIGTATIGQSHSYSIRAEQGRYVFQFDNKIEYMHREVPDPVLNGYSLYPYFGGDETAPHDIRVYLKETPQ